jgi:hypothetical protein
MFRGLYFESAELCHPERREGSLFIGTLCRKPEWAPEFMRGIQKRNRFFASLRMTMVSYSLSTFIHTRFKPCEHIICG